ncbi:MAG TPA: DUF5693 family protein, partial [Armatimonadota bacterium]|nr:DUF5693 family protein [Armatimonadota bacterium]
MMTRTQSSFTYALMVVGALAAVWVLNQRMAVERANTTVGIAVDFLEVEQLAAATGGSLETVMNDLRQAGATHLALTEDSLQGLMDRGQATLFGEERTTRLWVESSYRLAQAAQALSASCPGNYSRPGGKEGENWLRVPSAATANPAIGVGYSHQALVAARAVGMKIVARPLWQGVRSQQAVESAITMAADTDARIVVFSGDQILGFPGLVGATADALRQHNLTFGFIELAPQNGDAALASKLDYSIVRVHSITDQEMRTISLSRAVDRFVRAAREREVRLLYLRLFPCDEHGPLRPNLDYLATIVGELRAQGLRPGDPAPLASLNPPAWLLALVRLGVCGGLLWVLQALFGLRPVWFWGLAAVVLAGGSTGMMVATGLVRSLAALVSAIVFPTIAVCWGARTLAREKAGRGEGLWLAVVGFLGVCAITAVGGLLIAGLLSDSAYMTRIAQFRGVKLAQLVPLIGAALIWLARQTPQYRERQAGAADKGEWRSL